MAFKKNNKRDFPVETTEATAEVEETNQDGKLIDKNTGKPFPEAPRERQGDGVATGEVPAGYYNENK